MVSVWGGGRGTVVKNVGGGRLEVRMQDGSVQRIHRNYLTVQKRPGGGAPTSQASANSKAMQPLRSSVGFGTTGRPYMTGRASTPWWKWSPTTCRSRPSVPSQPCLTRWNTWM